MTPVRNVSGFIVFSPLPCLKQVGDDVNFEF